MADKEIIKRGNWVATRLIGSGGQGSVHQASEQLKITDSEWETVRAGASVWNLMQSRNAIAEDPENVLSKVKGLLDIALRPKRTGALKILSGRFFEENPDKARARFTREFEVMKRIEHPHLLRVLDGNPQEDWFVAEYHPGNKLTGYMDAVGNVQLALDLLRPLVEGVAKLHSSGQVHRDIKPDNIFLAEDGRLVLGDFGLIVSSQGDETRLSEESENVGSWGWMPVWAEEKKLEEINPTFDTFSLGKVLWALLSGKKKLKLWYVNESENDLRKQFPAVQEMKLIQELLGKCVVEHERDSKIRDAGEFLKQIDLVKQEIDGGPAQLLSTTVARKCRVCAKGFYKTIADRRLTELQNFGIGSAVGGHSFIAMTCNQCGHVDLFHVSSQILPAAWEQQDPDKPPEFLTGI